MEAVELCSAIDVPVRVRLAAVGWALGLAGSFVPVLVPVRLLRPLVVLLRFGVIPPTVGAFLFCSVLVRLVGLGVFASLGGGCLFLSLTRCSLLFFLKPLRGRVLKTL